MQQAVGKRLVKAGGECVRRGICSLWLWRFKNTVDIDFTLSLSGMELSKEKRGCVES